MTAPDGSAPRAGSTDSANSIQEQVEQAGQRAKTAALRLATLNTQTKNDALLLMAEALVDESDRVLEANASDVASAEALGLSDTLIDRLTLTPSRMAAMADGVRA